MSVERFFSPASGERTMVDRILCTHVGALPTPPDLLSLEGVDDAHLRAAVNDVVRHQRDCGVDIVNEGEFTKGGSWVAFLSGRLTGFEPQAPGAGMDLFRQ